MNTADIVPVLRTTAPGANAPVEIPAEDRPIAEPLGADILVCYAVDQPAGWRFICPWDCGKLGIEPAELRKLAMANLKRRVPGIDIAPEAAPLYRVTGAQGHESTALLLKNLWNTFTDVIHGEIVAAAPARDILIFTGTDHAGAVDRLSALVEEMYPQLSEPLSRRLLIRREDRWLEL